MHLSSFFNSSLLLVAALSLSASAQFSSQTCNQIRSSYPDIEITFRGQLRYTDINLDYWSTECTAQKPACIILPSSALQLSTVITLLNQNNEDFAVKSGGHTPNCFSTIAGGPLISTKRMNQVDLNVVGEYVNVGPGNRWMDVTEVLDGTGWMVVGGRMGEVGVSGLTLGGGLSFLSAQYGWAANNVLEFEVVLPNATIVTASETVNSDLWSALRGGGGSFGFVTNFRLKAYRQDHDIWGGIRIFDKSKTPQLLNAIRAFTENYDDYPKAGIIATTEVTLANLVDIWIIFMFYDDLTVPAGVFDVFDAIPHTLDLTKTRSMHDMLLFDNTFVLKGSIYTIATETMALPNSTVGPTVMQGIYDTWHDVALTAGPVAGAIVSMALQPLPKRIHQISQSLGGVVMDFEPGYNGIVIEFDYSHLLPINHPVIDDKTVETYTKMGNKISEYEQSGLLPDIHRPLFMNDAYFRQDYWGRLKPETRQRFQAIQDRYDPLNILSAKTRGFHV